MTERNQFNPGLVAAPHRRRRWGAIQAIGLGATLEGPRAAAATVEPRDVALPASQPRPSQAQNAPQNASPAPVVSTTDTARAGMSCSTTPSFIQAPCEPRVMTTL